MSSAISSRCIVLFLAMRAIPPTCHANQSSFLSQIGKDYFRQKSGIPQGSNLSTHLCSFFYAHMEKKHLGFTKSPDCVSIGDFTRATLADPSHYTDACPSRRRLPPCHHGLLHSLCLCGLCPPVSELNLLNRMWPRPPASCAPCTQVCLAHSSFRGTRRRTNLIQCPSQATRTTAVTSRRKRHSSILNAVSYTRTAHLSLRPPVRQVPFLLVLSRGLDWWLMGDKQTSRGAAISSTRGTCTSRATTHATLTVRCSTTPPAKERLLTALPIQRRHCQLSYRQLLSASWRTATGEDVQVRDIFLSSSFVERIGALTSEATTQAPFPQEVHLLPRHRT